MDLLANSLSCLHAACTPFPPPLPIYLLYCSRRLQGCQRQVQRGRRWEEGKGKREREDWQGPGGQLECMFFCFPHLICIDKMFFSSSLFFSFFHFHYYTPHIISLPILFLFSLHLFCRCSCFSEQVPLSLSSFSFNLTVFFFYSQLPFFHFTVPPDLPSLPISLALGLLNCAFYLHTALHYSGGGGLFSSYAQFRDHTVPSTISIHLPPTFSSSHDCF